MAIQLAHPIFSQKLLVECGSSSLVIFLDSLMNVQNNFLQLAFNKIRALRAILLELHTTLL